MSISGRFCRYTLRTTDVEAARSFYRDLLGDRFWEDGIEVEPLPAQAAARGAPSHWLGHLGVDDVMATLHRFVQSGATQLGPAPRPDDPHPAVILRDPFGAIVALTHAASGRRGTRVAWHLLSAQDEARALALYADLFGWTPVQALDLGPERGRQVTFTWDGTGRPVGSTTNMARLPHVHPQWLFFFSTQHLEESLVRVRALGGSALEPMETPEGDLVAPCEDAQGAAFALFQTCGG